jgi:quercetin dioxygenase-like cupin family protein
MKLIRSQDVAQDDFAGALFPAGPVQRRSLVNKPESAHLSITWLHFAVGKENAFHIHTHDQVVLVIEGVALCANETERFEAQVGELVVFPAGENHMHGPKPGHACTMLSLTPAGTTTTVT